jgi:hypothetical protein
VFSKLSQGPHIAWNQIEHFLVVRPFDALLGDRIVGKVAEQIFVVSRVVVITAETYVALFIHIDLQWIPAWHNHPHAHVTLTILNQQRIFDVFLNYPAFLCNRNLTAFLLLLLVNQPCHIHVGITEHRPFYFSVLSNLSQVVEQPDFSAARKPTWFYDPQVISSVEFCLRVQSRKLFNLSLAKLSYLSPHLRLR